MNVLQYGELARLVRDMRGRAPEFTDDGLMVMGTLKLGGVFELEVKKHHLVLDAIERGDPEREAWMRKFVASQGFSRSKHGYELAGRETKHNLIPDAGLNFILDLIYLPARTKVSTWYAPVFISDATPDADWLSNWAGATSGPLATELANASYDESGRQALTFSTAAASKSIASGVSTYTLAAGTSGIDAYGIVVTSTASVAYDLTDKYVTAATRFDDSGSSTKSGLGATDELGVRYTLTGASA